MSFLVIIESYKRATLTSEYNSRTRILVLKHMFVWDDLLAVFVRMDAFEFDFRE